MRKVVRTYLIPHQDNNYKPKLFEYAGLSALLVVAVIVFLGSVSVNKFVRNTELGASVYASVLVDLTNESRTENDRPLLAINDKLTLAAQMKANDMAEKHYFAHTSPLGITPWFWLEEAHYSFTFAGENLAVDFTETQDVQNALYASPTHRENILDSRFREIGIATKTAFFEGRETTFVVEMFGTPAVVIIPPPPTEEITPAVKIATATVPKNTSSVPKVETVKSATSEEVAVVTETPSSIVVENTTATPNTIIALAASTDSNASVLEKALIRTPTYTHFILLALAAFLLLALILFIFIEIKRQHPWRIFLGILLLVVVLFLAYATKSYYLVAS